MLRTWGGFFKIWWGGWSFSQCMGKHGGRDSLEKGKYLANSYTTATVNVNYKLSSFFQCYFRSVTEILMAVCSFWIFFQESSPERGLYISMNGRFIFSGGFIFKWRGHHIGVTSAFMGGGAKTFIEWEVPQSCLTPLGQTLVCVVTGLKRSMNYNMLWKIYKKRILTLQEKTLLQR